MKKILFLTTGGTIASNKTDLGLAPSLHGHDLIDKFPEIRTLCEPFVLPLCHIDSTNMTPDLWEKIAAAIETNYNLYDGFIICHGTDTMAYTSAALSYMIQHSPKPIVLTGAQKPISFEITDAKKNLRDSILYATDPDSHDVVLIFNGQVIAGTRAKKVKTYSFDAFKSINFPFLAQIQENRIIRYLPPEKPLEHLKFHPCLNPKVFLLKLTPGISPQLLDSIFRIYDCIIIESFGVGGIPLSIADTLRSLKQQYTQEEKILVLTTQVTYEGSHSDVYEVGRRYQHHLRFLEAHDMTLEAVYTKMMWIMSHENLSYEEIKRLFYTSINFDTVYKQ